MRKTLAFTALAALLCLGSCVKDGTVDRGDINAAIKLTATDVTAASATISGTSAQDNVVSCIFVNPVEASSADFVNKDAIDRKAYILEHGTETAVPFEISFKGSLKAETSYTVAVIGKDANGVYRTAPYYITFKTGKATVNTTISMEEATGGFKYTYGITKGENTSSFKYIVSSEKAVVALDEAGLTKLITAGGDNVKTSTEDLPAVTFTQNTKSSVVVAALAYDEAGNVGGFSSAVYSAVTVVKTVVNGTATTLKETSEGSEVYEGTVAMPATASFFINKDNVDYGFVSYSGAGGVGTINNEYSVYPFVNLTSAMTYKFQVSKALGQMAPAANAFFANMTAAANVKVTADFSQDPAIYRFEVVDDDPNLVFYEGFDLSVWGGFYQAPVKGCKPTEAAATLKGTEVGVKDAAATTGMGLENFDYPSSVAISDTEIRLNDTLFTNWGLKDWTFKKGYLSCGHIRLAASTSVSCVSYVITPKFTKLTAPTKVTVTIEGWNFAAAVKDVYFKVLGAGKFTAATVTNTAGYNSTFAADGTGALTETTFTPDGTMFVKHANADINKTITKVVLTIEGATADTQLRLGTDDTPITTLKDSRVCIDYIRVTK